MAIVWMSKEKAKAKARYLAASYKQNFCIYKATYASISDRFVAYQASRFPSKKLVGVDVTMIQFVYYTPNPATIPEPEYYYPK